MKNQGRRRFLKTSLQSGLALGGIGGLGGLLSSCATLDRLILSGKARDPHEVLILGGGLAGLTAAYACKKNGIPFLLFEANSRMGGRVLSLSNWNGANQAADLGGEWIQANHGAILGLCKELNVELAEMNLSPSDFEFFEGGKRQLNLFRQELKQFRQQMYRQAAEIQPPGSPSLSAKNHEELSRAHFQDMMSTEEFLGKKNYNLSSSLRSLVQRQVQLDFGVEPTDLSSLAWLQKWNSKSDIFGFSTEANKVFKVSGGSGLLTQALYDRVAGVIPDQNIRRSHELIAIGKIGDFFELSFQTASGVKSFQAQAVISCLPIGQYKSIRGIGDLAFEPVVLEYLLEAKMGLAAKGVISFKERPWKKLGFSRFTGDFQSQFFFESEPATHPKFGNVLPVTQAILGFQLGGAQAAEAGPESLVQAEKDLQNLKLSSGIESNGEIHNWANSPFTKGLGAYFKPGQISKYGSVLQTPQAGGRWTFAGEHLSSLFPGTMNGAVESGLSAVQKILQLRKV